MPKSLVIVVVLLVGFVAYLVGVSGALRPPAATESARREVTTRPDHEAGERPSDPDGRVEALLRETRDATRSLRAAVGELTAELRAARVSHAAATDDRSVAPTAEQWAARMRAREPDLVIDTACRLRERMLTRALQLDASAESAVGPIFGLLDPKELQAAQAAQVAKAKMYREGAERCRAANKALDAVRTLDDLARWRAAHGEGEF